MESNKRIRMNIRLELDATNNELKMIDETLKKGKKDELMEKRAEELRAYQKKLQSQYEAVAGRSAISAAHLDGERRLNEGLPIYKKLTGAVTALVFFALFYNLALQALTAYGPMDYINSLSTTGDLTFLNVMQSIVNSVELLTYLAIAGITLAFITGLMTFKRKALVLDSILNIALIVVFTYPIIGTFFEINKIGDISWLYYPGHGYVAAVLAIVAVVKLAIFIPSKKFKIILPNIIEGVLILSAGLSLFLAADTGDVQNIYNVWLINYSLLLGSSLFATIKYLLMD